MALAAPGPLTWVETERDVEAGGAAQGLAAPDGVAIGPGGAQVYVASEEDDAVVTFTRDPTTGGLVWADVDQDPSQPGGLAQGLDGAHGVAVAPDGKNVYVTGMVDNAVATFTRDLATGELTWLEQDRDPPAPAGTEAEGLGGARGVVVSPDNKTVYVTGSSDRTIVALSRDPSTGALTWIQRRQDPSKGGTAEGLDLATAIAISPDSRHVYVASAGDSAVVSFLRDTTTGSLTYLGCLRDPEASGSGCTAAQGLGSARGIAVSPGGANVYAAGRDDNAVVTFSRDSTSGALTRVEEDRDPSSGGLAEGLGGSTDVTVSTDGADVYATGASDDALVVFSRSSTTGALSWVECHRDVGTPGTGCAADEGLDSVVRAAVSADGKDVYATGAVDDTVVAFRGTSALPPEEPPPGPAETPPGSPDPTPPGSSGTPAGPSDATPPETDITTGPKSKTEKRKAKLKFTSTEPGSTFECKLDKAEFAPCDSPFKERVKADRKHKFLVRAIDLAGNADLTPAKWKWKVRAPGPN